MNNIKARQKQFAQYSLLAASLVTIVNEAEAQVIYTDLDPDTVLDAYWDDVEFMIDMNADAINDFHVALIYSYSSSAYEWLNSINIYISGFGENKIAYTVQTVIDSYYNWTSETLVPETFYYNLAIAINSEDTIDSGFNFNKAAKLFQFNCDDNGATLSGWTTCWSIDNWFNEGEKFAGIQLNIDGEIHYGWIRLSLETSWWEPNKLIIFDYAYEASAEVSIIAGKDFSLSVILDAALNVDAADIDNFGDGRDVQIVFDKAANEINIQEYRLFVVPAEAADSFSLDDASASLFFTSIPTTGSDITTIFSESTKDIDGAFITYDVPYKVFVLSYSDTIPEVINTLSAASNEILLNEPVNIPEPDDAGIKIFSQFNYLHVRLNVLNDKTNLSVTDNVGRKVFETPIIQMQSAFALNLPNGIYIASIYSGNKIYSQKIVIHE
ncbi:MAG: T9SS type A sorting domain-containing protein [Fimbriimonadaceae bacterium]|nr:T9SS type A sorting domain-containing protein [Chitinophagales bacterium]